MTDQTAGVALINCHALLAVGSAVLTRTLLAQGNSSPDIVYAVRKTEPVKTVCIPECCLCIRILVHVRHKVGFGLSLDIRCIQYKMERLGSCVLFSPYGDPHGHRAAPVGSLLEHNIDLCRIRTCINIIVDHPFLIRTRAVPVIERKDHGCSLFRTAITVKNRDRKRIPCLQFTGRCRKNHGEHFIILEFQNHI